MFRNWRRGLEAAFKARVALAARKGEKTSDIQIFSGNALHGEGAGKRQYVRGL